MLNFKKINIKDRDIFKNLIKKTEFENSEFSFANIFIWQNSFDLRLCVAENEIYISSTVPSTGKYVHFQPICTEKSDIQKVFENIRDDIKSNGGEFCIASANDYCVKLVKDNFPQLKVVEIPDMYDYVYLTEDLSNLEGKKYHKKRTHVNKFTKEYDYEYKRIDESNKHHCLEITEKWIEQAGGDPYNEHSAVELAIKNMQELELFGALIYVNDVPVAYTIAEAMTEDMALIHLEKATFDYRGAYPVINQQFAKRELLGKFKYINREEDMGIDGIRQAKKSYYPHKMVKKYDIYNE